MAMTEEQKVAFKKKMAEQLRQNQTKGAEKEKEVEKEVEEAFAAIKEEKKGKNQKMFSELFFDPSIIGMPDRPVDTFHHMHKEWPEWVRNMVPIKDEAYVWNKQAVYEFVTSDDEHAFLVGYPGSGKTTLPLQVAAVTGRPVFKQSFQRDLEADEWLMSKEIDDSGTHWKVLPFVETLAYPFYSVLDEFNRLTRGGRLLMNRLLDEGGTLQLRDGREVVPHSMWRAVATDNTRGMGDGLDMFDGDVSDISTTDRFGIMLEIKYLSHDEQVELIKKWFPEFNDKMAIEIVQFGERVVAGFSKGVFPLPWTPRRMKKTCKLAMRYRNPVAALRSTYYNFLAEDSERKACNQILKDIGLARKYEEFA